MASVGRHVAYLCNESRSLCNDKHDDDGKQHDRDLILMAVVGQTLPRQLVHHCSPGPSGRT